MKANGITRLSSQTTRHGIGVPKTLADVSATLAVFYVHRMCCFAYGGPCGRAARLAGSSVPVRHSPTCPPPPIGVGERESNRKHWSMRDANHLRRNSPVQTPPESH